MEEELLDHLMIATDDVLDGYLDIVHEIFGEDVNRLSHDEMGVATYTVLWMLRNFGLQDINY